MWTADETVDLVDRAEKSAEYKGRGDLKRKCRQGAGDGKRDRETTMYEPGTMKSDVDEKWTLDGTGGLIERVNEDGEESVEGMETASRTTRPGMGRE